MKRIGILMLIVFTCLLSGEWLQAQRPTAPPSVNPRIPSLARKPGVPQIPRLLQRTGPPILPASAARDVIQVQCPPEAVGAVCGYVPVPLDRKHPKQGTINIYFELYPHSGSGPAESAILVNFGGPGLAATTARDWALYLFWQNLDVHDLLLIDDRGRGLSGTINCEELQHGTAVFSQAEADCAAQLGTAASRYGTGDIAQDTDAVRAALGYDKVDYFGWSYGGADVVAYATRFGEHLRSIVLDGPYGGRVLDNFGLEERCRSQAEPRMVRLDCQRSPACSADHLLPTLELNALIWTVRLHPAEGDAYDANGNLMHVRIDEDFLLNYLIDNHTGNFTSTGELLAAAAALWKGDPAPLLRLAAEGYFPLESDSGDPTFFSMGASEATACVDLGLNRPWDWSAPASRREAQFAHAVSHLPWDYFAPFSKAAATGLRFSFTRQCLWWEKPAASSPILPPNPTFPYVPVLVLSGDMDNRVPLEENRDVAAFFPDSIQVVVAESGHGTWSWTQCGAKLASDFIQTLQVGDTSCAATPETVWPAVGRFPLLAKEARPAQVDPNGQNQVGLNERKVATVAVAAATDVMQRSFIGWGDGVAKGRYLPHGLRLPVDGDPDRHCPRQRRDRERKRELGTLRFVPG